MRLSRAFWLFVATFAIWQWLDARPIDRRPGVLASEQPEQHEIDGVPRVHRQDAFRLHPRATFTATVRVLGRERYRFDPNADLIPLDLAVGWGRMSDTSFVERIDISQSGRFYFWSARELPMPRSEIESHSANWHLIPSDRAVRRSLERVRVGDVVTIRGELVDVETADGRTLHTSLRRDDTGAGACEIIRVEAVTGSHES